MKYILCLIILGFIIACNQNDSGKKTESVIDSSQTIESVKPGTKDTAATASDSLTVTDKNSSLLKLSEEILQSLKTKDLAKLATYVHPDAGLRFSPYAWIDTLQEQVLSITKLVALGKQQTTINWGEFDGTGNPIKMSINKYFDRFVYSKDFLTAEKKTVNKSQQSGGAAENLKKIYPAADFTEFYFSGFDPKYEGMDWQKLQLVFRIENNKPYLIAIIHDEWTI
jgi:hypothetical protein